MKYSYMYLKTTLNNLGEITFLLKKESGMVRNSSNILNNYFICLFRKTSSYLFEWNDPEASPNLSTRMYFNWHENWTIVINFGFWHIYSIYCEVHTSLCKKNFPATTSPKKQMKVPQTIRSKYFWKKSLH